MAERLKLGEIVLRAGVIDELQLQAALGEQKKWGSRLGLVLVRLGYLTEQELVQAVASQLGLPVATLDSKRIPPQVLELVPHDYAEAHMCLPLFLKEVAGVETLFLAMDDPSNLHVLDDLAFRTSLKVSPVVVATSEILDGIDRFYRNVEAKVDPFAASSPYFGRPSEMTLPASGDDVLSDLFHVASRDTEPLQEEVRTEDESTTRAQLPEIPAEKAAAPTILPTDEKTSENQTAETKKAALPDDEPSTRLLLHAVTQILIEKELMTREEFYHRVRALTSGDEGDSDQAS